MESGAESSSQLPPSSRAYSSEQMNRTASVARDGEINTGALFISGNDPPLNPSNLAIPFAYTSRPKEEEMGKE